MKNKFKKIKYLKLFLLVIILVLPFSSAFNFFDEDIDLISSDLRFYEINTCSIPLLQFLNTNPNVAYQDHYNIRANNYSSIICHGTITGVDQIGYEFYVSIGTNTFLNIMTMSLLLMLIISLIKPSDEYRVLNYKYIIFSSIIASIIMLGGIYGQKNFYSKNFYIFKFDTLNQYLKLFLLFLIISLCFTFLYETRKSILFNYVPFVFILPGIVSGTTFSILGFLLVTIGINHILQNLKKYKNIIFAYSCLVSIWIWIANYYIQDNTYNFDPDKIIGLAITTFNPISVIYISLFFIFLVSGVFKLTIDFRNPDYLGKLFQNFTIASCILLLSGIVASNFPIFNFFFSYFSGQHKLGTTENNLFNFNEWGEFTAWRGVFPSAETAGEFFAFNILLYFIFTNFKLRQVKDFMYLVFPFTGLMLSNNRSAIFLLTSLLLIVFLGRSIKKSTVPIVLSLAALAVFVVGIQNLSYSVDFMSDKIINVALDYSFEEKQSSGIINLLGESNIFTYLFSLFSIFGFLVNRSEMWGIFLARYDSTVIETFFGVGPYNLIKHYSLHPIEQTNSFLLPHSSLLNSIIFFGFVGTILIIMGFALIQYRLYKKKNFNILYMNIFIFINLLKSDSILYVGSLVFYLSIFYLSYNMTKNEKINSK